MIYSCTAFKKGDSMPKMKKDKFSSAFSYKVRKSKYDLTSLERKCLLKFYLHDIQHMHSHCKDFMKMGIEGAFEEVMKDRKSTRLNSSHITNSYAVLCLKKKKKQSKLILFEQKENENIYDLNLYVET